MVSAQKFSFKLLFHMNKTFNIWSRSCSYHMLMKQIFDANMVKALIKAYEAAIQATGS